MRSPLIIFALLLFPLFAFAEQREIASDNGNAGTMIELKSTGNSRTVALRAGNLSDTRFAAVRFYCKKTDPLSDGFSKGITLIVNNHKVPVPWEVVPSEGGWVKFPVDIRMLSEGRNEIRIMNESGADDIAAIGTDNNNNPLIRLVLDEGEDAGLIGRWDFEQNTQDLSGYDNYSLENDMRFEPGQIGYGHSFNGKNGIRLRHYKFAGISEEVILHDSFSFEAWVKPVSYSDSQSFIFDISHSKVHFDISRRRIYLKLDEEGVPVLVYWNADGSTLVRNENVVVPLNEWSKIGVVYDRGCGYIILNGRVAAAPGDESTKRDIASILSNTWIGGDLTDTHGLKGILDEVRIRKDSRISMVPLDVRLKLANEKKANVGAYAFGMFPGEIPATLSYEVKRISGGQIIQSGRLASFEGRRALASFSIDGLAAGKYSVHFKALDTRGSVLGEDEESFEIYDPAQWAAELDYDPDEVLPPWTPVLVTGNVVSVWGREYNLNGSLFPVQIKTRDENILYRPIYLSGKINSHPFTVSEGNVTAESHNDGRAIFSAEAQASGLIIKSRTEIEFDGMALIHLDIDPGTSVQCDVLNLVIPINRKNGTHFSYYPCVKYPEQNFGAIPKSFTTRFLNHVWIGDTRRGLAWFAESYRTWPVNPKKNIVSITADDQKTELVISIVNEKSQLREPIHVIFGLQATPVKAMPKDHRNWNISGLDGEIHQDWPNKASYNWYTIPNPVNDEEYRNHMKTFQERGVRFIPFGFFSDIDTPLLEEYSQYAKKWDGQSYEWDISHMRQYSRFMCPRQPDMQDFWCVMYKRYLEKYNADGFYFDGSWPLVHCYNPTHEHTNCFYFDKYGTKHYETAIFAYREMMKKTYSYTKKHNPANIIVNHCSAALLVPILSFGDALLDGEHLGGQPWFDGDYIKILTDDVRIAEFCGDQFGIECLWLSQFHRTKEGQTPANARQMIGLLLLHDTRLWAGGLDRETSLEVLKTLKNFGIVDAEFTAFFHEKPLAKPESKDVRVSAYKRGNDILFAIMNLSSEKIANEAITLNQANAGLSPADKLAGSDEETRAGIPIDGNGSFSLDLPARDFRLVRVTKNEGR